MYAKKVPKLNSGVLSIKNKTYFMWELKINSAIPKNLKIDKKVSVKKSCENPECSNEIKRRGKKAKYCCFDCYQSVRIQKATKKCKQCKTNYISSRQRKHFCSKKCFMENITKVKFCENPGCSNEIKRAKEISKYCSIECYKYVRTKHIERITNCQANGCGKELKKLQIKSQQKYCCKECYQKQRKTEYNNSGEKISFRKSKFSKNPRRYIKTENGWLLMSRYVWELNNGPLPKFHHIGFVDGDSFNDQDINNLVLTPNKINLKGTKNKDKN